MNIPLSELSERLAFSSSFDANLDLWLELKNKDINVMSREDIATYFYSRGVAYGSTRVVDIFKSMVANEVVCEIKIKLEGSE